MSSCCVQVPKVQVQEVVRTVPKVEIQSLDLFQLSKGVQWHGTMPSQ